MMENQTVCFRKSGSSSNDIPDSYPVVKEYPHLQNLLHIIEQVSGVRFDIGIHRNEFVSDFTIPYASQQLIEINIGKVGINEVYINEKDLIYVEDGDMTISY